MSEGKQTSTTEVALRAEILSRAQVVFDGIYEVVRSKLSAGQTPNEADREAYDATADHLEKVRERMLESDDLTGQRRRTYRAPRGCASKRRGSRHPVA